MTSVIANQNADVADVNLSAERFRLIELDLGNDASRVVAPVTPPASLSTARLVRPDQDLEVVCATGAARAANDEKVARSLGLTPRPPVYEIGTRVNSLGVENFRRSREDWSALPSVPDACRNLRDLVRDERRADIVVDVPSLEAFQDGRIEHRGTVLRLSERAMDGLATHVSPGGAAYLRQCPPELRATNLNHWFRDGYRRDARASKAAGRDVVAAKYVTLRTRTTGAGGASAEREAFAVVGPRYTAYDIDRVAEQIAAGAAGDARAEVTYDGYRATVDVVFHSNVAPENAVAGEFFKAVCRFQAADDGTGAIKASIGLWRNLCRNLIIVDFSKVLVGSRKHVGNVETIEETVRAHVKLASDRISKLVEKWSEATTENVLARYNLTDVDDVFRGLVLNKVVRVPGLQPSEMVERLHRAWAREPGYSKTAILNAITRAAHEGEWSSWSTQEDLESAAGELLFARTWNCIPPKELTPEELLA